MRNILEYPVTIDEKIKFLLNVKEQWLDENKDVVGSPTPYIIDMIIEDIWRLNELINS